MSKKRQWFAACQVNNFSVAPSLPFPSLPFPSLPFPSIVQTRELYIGYGWEKRLHVSLAYFRVYKMNLLYMHLFWSHSLPILDPGSPSYFPQQETNTEGNIPIESPPPNKCEMESIREGNFTFGNNIFV